LLEKRIILTGSTYGIGASIAKSLVREGATVASMARSVDTGEAQARDLGAVGPGTIRFHRCDVSVRAEV
jgi:NAD(P)-dependent dehydrogenase (short-subunit alcohol dehydrogenase family)